MSSGQIAKTDVNSIRSLLLENKDLAQELREKAKRLYLPDSSQAAKAEPEEVSGGEWASSVGKEFISLLNDLRSILGHTHEALTGFNG